MAAGAACVVVPLGCDAHPVFDMFVFVCLCACVCACIGVGCAAAAVVVDARFRVPAVDLLFAGGRGGSLADRLPQDSDASIGSGFFGKVGTFTYNGAAVAVKELKTGALDAASICAFFML